MIHILISTTFLLTGYGVLLLYFNYRQFCMKGSKYVFLSFYLIMNQSARSDHASKIIL